MREAVKVEDKTGSGWCIDFFKLREGVGVICKTCDWGIIRDSVYP
jgi:hypothetical protein